jgi:hypothetical protein
MDWQLGDVMHDEQDFLAAHGCASVEEYDRKRFFEWVDAMEEHYAPKRGVAIPKHTTDGVIIPPIESNIAPAPNKLVKQSRSVNEAKHRASY